MAYMSVVMEYDDIAYGSSGEITSRTPMTIFLDSIEDISVNESSTLTAHPVASGYEIADHMVRNPVTMDINGAFSMNGSSNILIRNDDSRVSTSNLSLKNFQKQFKRMKDEGFKCKITKIVRGTGEVRFLARDNMVLTSIQWTEKINSVSFNFNFKEAMSADIVTIPYTQEDENLPAQTQPNVMSFSSTLMDWNALTAMVVAKIDEKGLIEKDFLNYLASKQESLFIAGAAVAIGTIVALAATGVGAVLIAVGAVAVGLYFIFKAIADAVDNASRNKLYRIEQFKYYADDMKQQKEVNRFNAFIGSIHQLVDSTLTNTFYLYRIGSNEPQECYLTIGSKYYNFKFLRNNSNGMWGVTVTDPLITDAQNNEKIVVANRSVACAKTSFDQCTSANYLFRAEGSGAYVYLIRKYDNYDVINTEGQRLQLEGQYNLTNYYILVSGINPDDFNKLMEETINNALLR